LIVISSGSTGCNVRSPSFDRSFRSDSAPRVPPPHPRLRRGCSPPPRPRWRLLRAAPRGSRAAPPPGCSTASESLRSKSTRNLDPAGGTCFLASALLSGPEGTANPCSGQAPRIAQDGSIREDVQDVDDGLEIRSSGLLGPLARPGFSSVRLDPAIRATGRAETAASYRLTGHPSRLPANRPEPLPDYRLTGHPGSSSPSQFSTPGLPINRTPSRFLGTGHLYYRCTGHPSEVLPGTGHLYYR
jgi:hypothetical protein